MQKIRYPKEPMHRIAYTKLTEQQILDALRATEEGPTSTSGLYTDLAGTRLRVVTDDGPVLMYRFASADRLAVSEGDAGAVHTGYGALALGDVVLVSHTIPGTQRAYTVIVDRATRQATVFELWFSGFDDNREVQREIRYGYVDEDGREPPSARHTLTNRLEGKGYYWRQDNGIETLEFYPSVIYSNFVDLTRFGGELGYCSPSDYIRLDDERYLYSRVEAEFSGIFTLYVLDRNTVKQVGVRLGFNENDELEYYMFNGDGEMVGQLATFSPFDDKGETLPLNPGQVDPDRRGARPVYRPMRTGWVMTEEEVEEAVARNVRVFEPSAMAGNKMPPSDALVGRAFTLRYDNGPALEYRFDDIETLRWRFEGAGDWRQERYEAWESAPNVLMFGHLLSGEPDHDSHTVVVDFDHALASCVHGTMGTEYIANESAARTLFGVIEGEGFNPPVRRRHHFTNELVGRALTWNYSPGLTSMHLYTTPHSLSWIIFLDNGAGGMEWSGPAEYVKIRDGIYLAFWLEEACNGVLGTILINEHTMHDCGVGYNVSRTNGLSLGPIGAHSRNAGRFDIMKYYERLA